MSGQREQVKEKLVRLLTESFQLLWLMIYKDDL